MNVSQSVGKWYDLNRRDLPWRNGKNPYFIWISEVILQQTRMKQGLNYYHNFIESFPTVFDLADSAIEDVLKIWQGLGYYSRARNMHKTARIIVDKYKGKFPSDINLLRQLPGIGDYSAAAIASTAFDIPIASIDGNVFRVLARYFGISANTDTKSGKNEFIYAASEILDHTNPGRHNQSMIELGALICTPKTPRCNECPINNSCFALKNNKISELPKKKNRVRITHRYFYYLVISYKSQVYLRQRKEKDIWELLYDFPVIEMKKKSRIESLVKEKQWRKLFSNCKVDITRISSEYKHVLSHQLIHAWFIELDIFGIFRPENLISIKWDEINNYPVSRLIEIYLMKKNKEKNKSS